MSKTYVICILVIIFASSAILGWFKEGRIIYFWDSTYPLNPSKALIDYSYTWSESVNLGETDILRVKLLPYLFFNFVTYNLLGLLFSQMSLYFFLFSISGIGMFFLIYNLLKFARGSEIPISLILIGSTSSTLFYMFNLYSMCFLWRIFSTSLFLYSALPFIFLVFVRFMEGNSFSGKSLLILASLFFVASISHPLLIILLLCFLSLYFLFSVLISKRKRMIKNFSMLLAVFLLINAYWLLPLAYNSVYSNSMLSGPYGGTLSALRSNSRFSSLLSLFRLKGQQTLYEQYQGEYVYPWISIYHDSNNSFFSLVPFLIPFICFFPLLFRKKTYLFFGGASLLLMFFVKGTHDPLGIFYEQFFGAFSAFRDPYSKFGLFFAFCLSFLFGAGITEICFLLRKIGKKLRLDIIIPLTMVFLLIGPYMFPMWNGDIIFKGTNIRPSAIVELPKDYIDLAEYLEKEAEQSYFKIMELPFQDRPLQSCIWNYGYVGFSAIRTLTFLPIISGISGNEGINKFYRSIYQSLETNPSAIAPVLSRLNIKYIILHRDINLNFAPPTADPEKLETLLEQSDEFTLVREFGKLTLWQLRNYYPLIYTIPSEDHSIAYISFEENENIALKFLGTEGTSEFSALNDSLIKHTGIYSLKITTASNKPATWRWFATEEIPVEENELYVTTHIKAKDIFRVNEIPAQVIKYTKINPTLYKVEVNASKPFMLAFAESYDSLWAAFIDGKEFSSVPLYSVINGFWINKTGNLEITIEYKPQKWFYYGLSVSVTTFIICIGYLVYDWRRKRINLIINRIIQFVFYWKKEKRK